MQSKTLIIDLLRHGETVAGHKFIGATDVALTGKGWQQMHEVIGFDRVELNCDYEAVITSPLIRCLDFSKKYTETHDIELAIKDDLSELDFGDWENKTSEELWNTDKQSLEKFWQNPVENTPPNAETLDVFNVRVNNCFENILKECELKKILLVAHAGTIKTILSNILSIPLAKVNNLNVSHASLSQIQCQYMDGEKYLSVNYINHQSSLKTLNR